MSCLGGEPLKAADRCTKSQEPSLNALGTLWVEARPDLREGQGTGWPPARPRRQRPVGVASCVPPLTRPRAPLRAGVPSLSSPGPSVARSPLGAMASRLLHRLRHALASDGPGEAAAAAGPEAEQFPESSELEDDDAEGLSSRLSGTLSFTSAEDDPDDEDEDDEASLDSPPSGDGTSGEDAGECGRTHRNPGAWLGLPAGRGPRASWGL